MFILGKMEGNMKGSGSVIKCTEKGLSGGQMGGSILVSTIMIGNMDMESFCGRMEKFIEGSGEMGNNMGVV